MLKFVKHHMDSIAGIEIYPIISMLIYISFFAGLYLWVFTYKKERIKELSEMPLKDEQ
ncbi:CcoQ/FixQ family Cbb3-type cytochrome c oxidase assembly chaperone [Flavobacterium sp. '19STA2R22 D10 B1']|uniref:CcoQ/FixQ family Cbb3-type cytochrome c oxidase assembly chaperone n=1 Tax=Flavobacterium aerium TaxID=3037261 RepID=UPI00278BCD15|nr:CcoQ/FixQ family Cbb3-type cytochrome c oxidase assembly chaperone [Flavobacterium sp. '19STA2R22 D10 B1']